MHCQVDLNRYEYYWRLSSSRLSYHLQAYIILKRKREIYRNKNCRKFIFVFGSYVQSYAIIKYQEDITRFCNYTFFHQMLQKEKTIWVCFSYFIFQSYQINQLIQFDHYKHRNSANRNLFLFLFPQTLAVLERKSQTRMTRKKRKKKCQAKVEMSEKGL